MADPKRYSVGYCRTPEHTRFQKGESGNPKGRPKGTRNLLTDVQEELPERIPIREGERHLRVSKQRAIVKALVSKAVKGDTRAAGQIIGMLAKGLGLNPEQPNETLLFRGSEHPGRFSA